MTAPGAATVHQLWPLCFSDLKSKKLSSSSNCFPTWNHIYSTNSRATSFLVAKDRNSRSPTICSCTNNKDVELAEISNVDAALSISDWDWDRWSRHFAEIEQTENYSSLLKAQLEDSIKKEDFQEAAKLKNAISQLSSKDSVADIMLQLKNAIEQERYHDASKLSKSTGSELVGWWVGFSNDSDDPFGKLVRITPGVGRYIARSYSPRQLVNSSKGTPLFEIFVVKDIDGSYVLKVVCLQRSKASSKGSKSSEIGKESTPEEETEDKTEHGDGATEEGIKGVINFLKEKLPGLKVKVMNVKDGEETVEEDEGKASIENIVDEDEELEEISQEELTLNDNLDDEKEMDMKFFISGVVHNNEDTLTKDDYARFPAEISDRVKGSFILQVPEKSLEYGKGEREASKVRVAAIAAKGISDLMPPEVAKAFLGTDKLSPKLSRNVREIVKLAVSQAQKQAVLSGSTSFSRIQTFNNHLDPFQGLFVGVFGPYGMEVVELRRKFGNWDGAEESVSDVGFYEYVEAVKLTGDYNVPAGNVIFRAKLGKSSRNSSRGIYPEDLGVVGSYKGQGKIAEFGFKNPKWVDGELLQLNGKGIGTYISGADLGFLYAVPDHSFMVLLNRLKLSE